jgi:nucleotide-binding universal stress UspA family protein
MPSIRKILLPVDIPNASFPVIHQAAALAHRFQSEIVMLHVTSLLSQSRGVPASGPELQRWDMLAEVISEAQKSKDSSLGSELQGLPIQKVVVKGGAAEEIVETAQEQKADLIMMPSGGHLFEEFLMGGAVTKAPQENECPVWTGQYVSPDPEKPFAIRNILCAVEFDPRDPKTVSWAAYLAQEFGAKLTLAHVTDSVEFWGPGGAYVNQKWKNALLTDATRQMARLQQRMKTQAAVFIGSGDVRQVLAQAVKATKADLLVTGSRPYGGNFRTHGYAIISAVSIPVLSV